MRLHLLRPDVDQGGLSRTVVQKPTHRCHPMLGTPAGGILRPSPTATPRRHAQRRATQRPEPPGAAHRRPPRRPRRYWATPTAVDEHGEDGEAATLPEASMVAPCLP